MKINRNKLMNCIYFFIVLIFIYTSNKSMLYNTLIDKDFAYYIFLTTSILAFICAFLFKNISINVKSILLTLLLITVYSFNCIIYNSINVNNLTFVFILIAVFLFSLSLNLDNLLTAIVNVMVFLSLFSLLGTYILQPIYMSGGLKIFNTFESSEGYPVINFIFSFPLAWDNLQRNFGVFNEPGTYQFFIILAYCIEKFFISRGYKQTFFIRVILIITLLSTFSTAGFISFVLIFIVELYDFFRSKNMIGISRLALILVFCFLAMLVFNSNGRFSTLFLRAMEKISSGLDNSSFFVRTISPLRVLVVSLKNPITGLSFNTAYELVYHKFYFDSIVHITGTFFIFIAGLGFPLGIYLIGLFYRSSKIICKDKKVSALVFTSLFLSSMSQNFVLLSLFWLILYFPFMRRSKYSGSEV